MFYRKKIVKLENEITQLKDVQLQVKELREKASQELSKQYQEIAIRVKDYEGRFAQLENEKSSLQAEVNKFKSQQASWQGQNQELIGSLLASIEQLQKGKAVIESQLKNEVVELNAKIKNIPPPLPIDNIITSLRNEIEKRLIDFHKEITNKCLSSMENILRYTKEVSLIETLANQVKDKDLAVLQTTLLRPIVSQRYEKENQEKTESVEKKILSMGGEILRRRDALKDEYLILNRQKKDTREIEIKLETLNWILEGEIDDTSGKIS